MPIDNTYIDNIADATELNLRIGLATGDTSTIGTYAWDAQATTSVAGLLEYLRRLMWPFTPQPNRIYYCRDFVASNSDAEWAAAQIGLTRQTGESNWDLLKRTLKAYLAVGGD